jgi:hypothetical protein
MIEASESEPPRPIEPIVLLLRYGAVVKGRDVARAGHPLLDAAESNPQPKSACERFDDCSAHRSPPIRAPTRRGS